MRNPTALVLLLALAGCATGPMSRGSNAPQEAIVQSEAARQAAAGALASGATADEALERAAAAPRPGENPKP